VLLLQLRSSCVAAKRKHVTEQSYGQSEVKSSDCPYEITITLVIFLFDKKI
jgi:hypothetical protein